jgi:hypothetical protein
VYYSNPINKVILTLPLMFFAVTVLSCAKADADSFEQLRRLRALTQGAPAQQLFQSWLRIPSAGGQQPDQFTGRPKPGTFSPPTSNLHLVGNAQANNAQSMQSGADPHSPMGLLFTVPTTRPAHFGPPAPGDMPFHVWSLNPGVVTGMAPATAQNSFPGTGAPTSDYVDAASAMTGALSLGQNFMQPSYPTDQAAFQGKLQQAERSSGSAANSIFTTSQNTLQQSLINVANEAAAQPISGDSQTKTLPQAIWMVQQLYKQLFIPMAVLLILPGAIMTQAKSAHLGTFSHAAIPSEDMLSPFAGILRAIIAIFMIPASQLIISYSIDIGNSMTYEVQNLINNQSIASWSQQQTSGTPPTSQQQEQQQEQSESTSTAMVGSMFNEVNMLLNYGLTVLIAYQLIMMSYLFLMGPIAAAFYPWPSGFRTIFKPVFGNWLDAVTNLALWRFWWCVLLLIMSTRIQWLQQMGQYNAQDPWEKAVYTAFMVMMMTVPFNPFEFRPGDLVDTVLKKAGVGPGSGGGA